MRAFAKAPSATTTRSCVATRSVERAIAVDPDLTRLGQLAASQQPTVPAAAGPQIPCCYLVTLSS